MEFTCTGTGTLTGQFTGQAIERIQVVIDSAGNQRGHIDEWIFGRSSDNMCGALRILENFTIDGSSGAVHGAGHVVQGTGDWVGASGEYDVNGVIVGSGFGGYTLTLRLPSKPTTSPTPCVPPLPTADQLR